MNGQTAASLSDLLYADRALAQLYDNAAGKVANEEARTQLTEIAADHRRHERELAEACAQADMQIDDAAEDVVDLMAAHETLVLTARNDGSVIEVLEMAERANAVLYEVAERQDLPEELSDLVVENHADERLHVSMMAEQMPIGRHAANDHDLACMTGGITDDKNPDDFD